MTDLYQHLVRAIALRGGNVPAGTIPGATPVSGTGPYEHLASQIETTLPLDGSRCAEGAGCEAHPSGHWKPRETALSATQSSEPGQRRGLCTCHLLAPDESCLWHELVATLERVAFETPADQALVELPHVQMQLNVALSDLRRGALQRRAIEWTGTAREFMARFELTRSNYNRLGCRVRRQD